MSAFSDAIEMLVGYVYRYIRELSSVCCVDYARSVAVVPPPASPRRLQSVTPELEERVSL